QRSRRDREEGADHRASIEHDPEKCSSLALAGARPVVIGRSLSWVAGKQDGEMADAKYDVLGIGNAIFDVLVQTDEGFLAGHGMTKGGMALIDEARAAAIYEDMGPATEMSGGSGANTIVGVGGFGARAAFI